MPKLTKHQVRVKAGKKAARTRKQRQLHGNGFFGDIWSGIKSVGNFVKDNKLISTGLSLIPHAGAQTAGRIAGQLGLGRKRKHMSGGGSLVLSNAMGSMKARTLRL